MKIYNGIISCKHYFQHFEIKSFFFELCTILLLGLYFIFWCSCLCYLIPILIMYFANIPPEVSHVYNIDLREYFHVFIFFKDAFIKMYL